MAEAIARVDASDTIEAFSAGLAPIGFVIEMTEQTLRRNGYWVDGLESKSISHRVWEQVDIVINISGRPRELTFGEYCKVEDWDIDDPYGENPDTYQRVFEEIRLRVAKLAQECRQDDAAGSPQARPSNLQRQIGGDCEQQNARRETPNAPRPGSRASANTRSASSPYITTPYTGVGSPRKCANGLARTTSQPVPMHTMGLEGEV